jgi:hypothetical protein
VVSTTNKLGQFSTRFSKRASVSQACPCQPRGWPAGPCNFAIRRCGRSDFLKDVLQWAIVGYISLMAPMGVLYLTIPAPEAPSHRTYSAPATGDSPPNCRSTFAVVSSPIYGPSTRHCSGRCGVTVMFPLSISFTLAVGVARAPMSIFSTPARDFETGSCPARISGLCHVGFE